MGTWGFGILSDDTARDIHGDYIGFYNQGQSHAQILKRLKSDYKADLKDQDMRVHFWFAVAAARWKCGALDDRTLAQVKKVLDTEQWKLAWEGETPAKIAKRQQAVKSFWTKLKSPNPKPITPKKPIQRKPIYQPGDCLAIRLRRGVYGAAIVLNEAPDENCSSTGDLLGTNLIGLLRYKSVRKPTRKVFLRRQWLMQNEDDLPRGRKRDLRCLCGVMRHGFRKYKTRFEIVGTVTLRRSDPSRATVYAGWLLADLVLLYY